jgi:hypothetical protein
VLNRLGIYQHRGENGRLFALIYPSMAGSALHHHVEWFKIHLSFIEEHRHLAREQHHIIYCARFMHSGVAGRVGAAMRGIHLCE